MSIWLVHACFTKVAHHEMYQAGGPDSSHTSQSRHPKHRHHQRRHLKAALKSTNGGNLSFKVKEEEDVRDKVQDFSMLVASHNGRNGVASGYKMDHAWATQC